jgi:cyanophycinase
MSDTEGVLALVGGGDWTGDGRLDAELLERSGGNEVLVIPTAAAFERPDRVVETARRWYAGLGAAVRVLMVLRHAEALDPDAVAAVAEARFIHVGGGSPLHLRSVLKGSPLLGAILAAWRAGAVLVGSEAGAMVLCDPMIDPRGGAFTVGLGVIEEVAVVPRFEPGGVHLLWRTLELAPAGVCIAGVPEATALVREPGGLWRAAGERPGDVTIYRDGQIVGLDALPA